MYYRLDFCNLLVPFTQPKQIQTTTMESMLSLYLHAMQLAVKYKSPKIRVSDDQAITEIDA